MEAQWLKLVSEQDIIEAATKSKLHLKCFDNCEFSFAHILIALVRKRLAERLRNNEHVDTSSEDHEIQDWSNGMCDAADIVESD